MRDRGGGGPPEVTKVTGATQSQCPVSYVVKFCSFPITTHLDKFLLGLFYQNLAF
jgi:hypothetical protein